MKRFHLLLTVCLAVSIFCFNGCKMDSDVLATYDNGKITRGEFNQWLDLCRIPKERVFDSIENQVARLRDMTGQRLFAIEAQASGFDKSADFQRLNSFFKEAFTSDFYRRKLKEKGNFSEDAAKLSIIKLNVKDYIIEDNKNKRLSAAELAAEYDKQMKQASDIIAELAGGASFASLAEKYSDDFSKKNGGNIGYIASGMQDPKLTEAAFALSEGEFTKEPVKTDGAVYIIKLDKKDVMTEKNIGSLINNEKLAEQLKARFQAGAAEKIEKELLQSPDVTNNIQTVNFYNKNAVVYKFGNQEELTVAAFEDLFKFVLKKVGASDTEIAGLRDDQKREIANMFLVAAVLSSEAMKNGIDKEKDYIKEWNFLYTTNLVGIYKNEVIFADINANPQQVYAEYQQYVTRMAERNKNLRPGAPREPIRSFPDVRPDIERMLVEQEQLVKNREQENALFEKYNLVINENKLEKGKNKPEQELPN